MSGPSWSRFPAQLEALRREAPKVDVVADIGWEEVAIAVNVETGPHRSDGACRMKWRSKDVWGPAAEEAVQQKPFEQYEESQEQLWQSQRQIILNENTNLRKRNQQLRALNAIVIEAVETSMARLPHFPPPPKHKTGKRRPESANLLLSDIHIGEVVKAEDVAGLGEYNWETMLGRMDLLCHSVLSIAEIERAARPIDVLNIYGLGDWVTNEDIYIGQGRDIDRILVDQLFEGSEALVQKLFMPFLERFAEVRFFSVYGNHGRLSGKKGVKAKRSNADYILAHIIRLRLQAIEHFKPYIATSPFMGFVLPEAPDFSHLIVHGDEIRSYLSLPYYGLERYTRKMISATSIVWDYVYLGHFHQAAQIDLSHGTTVINGSWVGPTEYSVTKLQAAAQPKQVFFGMHPEWGRTWNYNISLAPRSHLVANADGFYTSIWSDV